MMRVIRGALPHPRTWRGKLAIAAFVVTFIVLASTTAGYAYWQASTTATSTLDSADLLISTTSPSNVTFTNDALTSTGIISATNDTVSSSSQLATVTVTLSATGSSVLADNVSRQVWLTTDSNPSNCSLPSGTASTTWSTSQVVSKTGVGVGATVYWCVRSTLTSRDNVAVSYTAPAPSMTAVVTGSITLGSYSGSAASSNTQTTSRVFTTFAPDNTFWNYIRPSLSSSNYATYCLDVSGNSSASGTPAISYACKTNGVKNQQWMFLAVSGTSSYTIEPRNAPSLRLDTGGSTTSNAPLSVVTDSGADSQKWELQQTGTASYGFVNVQSGMCLTSPTGSSQQLGASMIQMPCDGTASQQFVVSPAAQSVGCSVDKKTNVFVWTWSVAVAGQKYHLVDQMTGTTIGATALTASTATTETYSGTYATSNYSDHTVLVLDGNNTVIARGTMTDSGNSNSNANENSKKYSCSLSDMTA